MMHGWNFVSNCCRLCAGPALALGMVVTAVAATNENARAAEVLPNVFYADPRALAGAKARLANHDTSLKAAFTQLIKAADEALKARPVSVTEKRTTPPSGDKHDYLSRAPYHWPNPKTKDGLPYVRRDGERNPETLADSDEGRFVGMSTKVQALAFAFYFTGRERYAAHAAKLVRVFFLNPATRMNPNLNFGQGIPGETEGRGAGLIEIRSLVQLADALQLLAKSKAWQDADQQAMQAWMAEYVQWLTTSKNGRDEASAPNNHGTFYDTQLAALAWFTGQTNLARNTLENARQKRIAKQVEPDGKQPHELARTKSLSYSLFNLRAMMDLASIGQNLGVDLWHYQTADGRGIRQALDFLLPYADRANPWPGRQIAPVNRHNFEDLLLRAAARYPDRKYADALKYFDADSLATNQARLMFRTADIEPAGAKRYGSSPPPASSHVDKN